MKDYLILTDDLSTEHNLIKAFKGSNGTIAGHSYQIMATNGHILRYASPVKMTENSSLKNKYKSWDTKNMPWDPYELTWKTGFIQKLNPKTGKIITTQKRAEKIKEVAQNCRAIILATNNDPSGEGDLLGVDFILYIHWKRPVYRMYFTSESPKTLLGAFLHKKNIASRQQWGRYLKAKSRKKWDFLSMQLTRIATDQVHKQGYSIKVVNEGRLQSVIMLLIYKQLQKVKHYKAVPQYQICYKDHHKNVFSSGKNQLKFKSLTKAKRALKKYHKESICQLHCNEATEAVGHLIDLDTLDAILESKGFSIKEVQKTYHKMYKNYLVSYPETTSLKLTRQQFNHLLPIVNRIAKVVGINPSKLVYKQLRKPYLNKYAIYGANRPGPKVPKSLTSLKRYGKAAPYIYKILAKAYLSIMMKDRKCLHVHAQIKHHPHIKIDSLVDSPLGKTAKPFIKKIIPAKPEYPNVKWLNKYLETYNIGTSSTRLIMLNRLTNSKYKRIEDHNGRYKLTRDGLICAIMSRGAYITSARITARLYQIINEVQQYKCDVNKVLDSATITIKHDKKIFIKNAKLLPKLVPNKHQISRFKLLKKRVHGKIEYWCAEQKLDSKGVSAFKHHKRLQLQLISKNGNPYFISGKFKKYRGKNGKPFYILNDIKFVNDWRNENQQYKGHDIKAYHNTVQNKKIVHKANPYKKNKPHYTEPKASSYNQTIRKTKSRSVKENNGNPEEIMRKRADAGFEQYAKTVKHHKSQLDFNNYKKHHKIITPAERVHNLFSEHKTSNSANHSSNLHYHANNKDYKSSNWPTIELNGKTVHFKPSFRGHQFTASELSELERGEVVCVSFRFKDDRIHMFQGKIGLIKNKKSKYYGFKKWPPTSMSMRKIRYF